MGYLDEAIRDHLALQRKRGVASDELERAEAEALGPVAESDLVESVSERAAEETGELALAESEAEQAAPELEPVEAAADAGQPTEAYDVAELDELLADTDEPGPTAVEPEGEADPLEQTPDFLQETPEHDRLWFEQKPPKDFDF